MTKRDDLLALAERVEAAAGADRGLDALIEYAIRTGDDLPWVPMTGACVGQIWASPADHHLQVAPAYTASLEAAMTLVPERYRWNLEADASGSLPFCFVAYVCQRDTGLEKPTFGYPCPNPALALTAAALRARAAMEVEHD